MAGRDMSNEQLRQLQAMLGQLEQGGLLSGSFGREEEKQADYAEDLYKPQQARRPQNEFVVDGDNGTGTTDTWSDFSNHYGGAPKQYTATQEEQYNRSQPPGGDYSNWYWVEPYGWTYKGNAEDGTAGKSSYINDAGQRVHHDPVPSLERDQQWWDSKRATIGLSGAWARGGDQFLREGGRYNETSNPYVETQDMREASQAAAANSPSGGGVYDPDTNTTFYGGMHYLGDHTQGKTQEDYSAEDWQYLTNDRYYTGVDQLTPQGWQYIKEQNGGRNTVSPFVSTFDWDVDRQLEYLGDSNWNPFYGGDGSIHQDMIDRDRQLGKIGEGLTDYEKRKEGNIADYMYNAFKDPSMLKHRGTALNNWSQWQKNNKINSKSLYARRMDQSTFDKLGLGDMGLTFDSSYGRPNNGANVASGTRAKQDGFLDSYLKSNKPIHSGSMGVDPYVGKPVGESFLDKYMERKNEIKPSVMSLMQELEDS